MRQVGQWDNLLAAWRKVRRNKGQGGSDGLSLSDFERDLVNRLRDIQRHLQQKTYQPHPLRAVTIPKPNHRRRVIRIPTVADRIVQQAVLNIIGPRFEQRFCECSYGFRPGKSAHQAVIAIQGVLAQGLTWVVEADLEDFFDTLDWTILLHALGQEIPDQEVLHLIKAFLEAGLLEGQHTRAATQGSPQGAVLSPVLANAYLHRFDMAMTAKRYRLVRYGDDFVTLHATRPEAEQAFRFGAEVLQTRLKLRLNGAKTRIVSESAQGFEFLSFRFAHGSLTPAPRATARFQAEVLQIVHTEGQRGAEPLQTRLDPLIRGWGEYFRIGRVDRLYPELDTWIRRQLRDFPGLEHRIASLTHVLAKRSAARVGLTTMRRA